MNFKSKDFIGGAVLGFIAAACILSVLSKRYSIIAAAGEYPAILKMDNWTGNAWLVSMGAWQRVKDPQ
jgi:hypothetical protein